MDRETLLVRLVACGLLFTAGCGGDSGGPAAVDTTPPAWERISPPAEVIGERRGLVPARGIIHLHSPFSHDACDDRPRENGETGPIREDCLAALRRGLCESRQDFAVLTDHDDTMADEEFPDLLVPREDDELVYGPDRTPYASRLRCADGHEVLLYIGAENAFMPIFLERHVAGDIPSRHALYDGTNAAAADAWRAAGGLVWAPHAEGKDAMLLRMLEVDGMEVFNIHAALDPKLRPLLGLDPNSALTGAIAFANQEPTGPEPDLAVFALLDEQTRNVAKWESLLGDPGRRVSVTAGTDVHENTFPITLRDGERGDSYRRLMSWMSNVALVADPRDPNAYEEAIRGGRFFVAFEGLGTPEGFDFRAARGRRTVAEMGGEIGAGDGARIEVAAPRVHDLSGALPEPEITVRLVRVEPGGSVTELGSGPGTISAPADAPGAYRAEVRIRPLHLAPYLGTLTGPGYAEREYPWVYSNPIYVRP